MQNAMLNSIERLKLSSYFFTLLYFIFLYGYINVVIELDFLEVSYLSVLTLLFCFVLMKINGVRINSILIYFSISVSFFIFGRFLAVIISDLFNLDLPHVTSLSDLLQVTWMTSYVPEYKDQVKLVMIVNVFVLLMTLGYITSDHSKERQLKSLIIKDNLMLAIRFVFIFSSIYYSFDIIQSINKVISGSYLALYEQSDTTG
ncbi:hypothetical protein, partial [Vibrio cholerae]|uniref:hypothetical protein n=1 Tax=Vibrio cholerae TaxID=666 RepID=UPI00155F090E